MKSKSGTTTTATKTLFTAEQVCSIIKACGEAHVSVLEFGDLRVRFGRSAEEEDQGRAFNPDPATEIAVKQAEISAQSLKRDEIAFREEQLAMAVIEDPVLAEKLLMEGELTADGTDEEET